MKKEKVNGSDLNHSFFLTNIISKPRIAATGTATVGNSGTLVSGDTFELTTF